MQSSSKSEKHVIVKSFSFDYKMLAVWEKFVEIIRKDGTVQMGVESLQAKNTSQAIINLLALYVKVHSDNPVPSLERFIEDAHFIALPSLGEMLSRERLDCMTQSDLEELERESRLRRQEIEAAMDRRRNLRLRGRAPADRFDDAFLEPETDKN